MVHPKIENYVINYSPSCHSKPVWPLFIFGTQIKIFLMKSANSLQRLRLPLAWPVYSPDMSPIEHVWDALDRCIRQRVPVPDNIQQLPTANITQATTNYLINSMRRRCVALREANGGHTRPPPQYSKAAHFRVVFYCVQSKAHLNVQYSCCLISILICYTCEVDDYLGKGKVFTNTDLDRFVNNIWEK